MISTYFLIYISRIYTDFVSVQSIVPVIEADSLQIARQTDVTSAILSWQPATVATPCGERVYYRVETLDSDKEERNEYVTLVEDLEQTQHLLTNLQPDQVTKSILYS